MTEIHRVVLGTAALGMSYGLKSSKAPTYPDVQEVAKLLSYAYESGITNFDTAPSYGDSEKLVGQYLSGANRGIWTKLSDSNAQQEIRAASQSIDSSLKKLRIDSIKYLQWHNWTEDLLKLPNFMNLWTFLKRDGRICGLGASTYGVRNAMCAIKSGLFDIVQIEWNLLNQSVLMEVEEEAIKRGVKIALRSIFLQGVLTQEGEVLPDRLQSLGILRANADKVAIELGVPLNCLAFMAALGQKSRPLVLVGVDKCSHLEELVKFANNPKFTHSEKKMICKLNASSNPLVDPRNW